VRICRIGSTGAWFCVDLAAIADRLTQLYQLYCDNGVPSVEYVAQCEEIIAAIDARATRFSEDDRRHATLLRTANVQLESLGEAVRNARLELTDVLEAHVEEKLRTLDAARSFADKIGDADHLDCPVCGQSVTGELLRQHIRSELERLNQISRLYDSLKGTIGVFCDAVRELRVALFSDTVATWREEISRNGLATNIAFLHDLNLDVLGTSCTDASVVDIVAALAPLIAAAVEASKAAAPSVEHLVTDRQLCETIRDVFGGREREEATSRAEQLISGLETFESAVRRIIRSNSQTLIDAITSDIQMMWGILHPQEPIEDVKLYIPDEIDKAIDIQLKFYGIEQASPRLTLSEGYRNSLGLCIFLAIAKLDGDADRPVILDDVVVSLDRNHRGMIIELFKQLFDGRQLILFTHDREWYAELRAQLPPKNWSFKTIMPYETPLVGIRLSSKISTFDDARALLTTSPDSAGNTARKIMDIELAVRAEKLKLRMEYALHEKNDHRTAHDFLSRIVADGAKCFVMLDGTEYKPNKSAINSLHEADILLVSWGNRASHTFDLVRHEAEKLILVCENALEQFDCTVCNNSVFRLDDSNKEFKQCSCGALRWRYGKA
jgi:hypothetical protein